MEWKSPYVKGKAINLISRICCYVSLLVPRSTVELSLTAKGTDSPNPTWRTLEG